MTLTLRDVQRIATDLAESGEAPLEMVGAIPSGGEYAEVVFVVTGPPTVFRHLVVGVSHNTTEPAGSWSKGRCANS
jgi:hypothetical protein